MYSLLKRALFQLDPERAHDLACMALPWLAPLAGKKFQRSDPRLQQKLGGLDFPNPLGLAAGFDKSATLFAHLPAFGFGFIEVGTLTPKAQDGNPSPRLFRFPESQSILNRMGFNNDGAQAALSRLEQNQRKSIVGVNIGKNKITPNEDALSDYLSAFKCLEPVADYMVVNVSSPNTPGLRCLQEGKFLNELFCALNEHNTRKIPLWLKIAPELEPQALDEICEMALKQKLFGLIATNTTLNKSTLPPAFRDQAGGVSGPPVKDISNRVLAHLARQLKGQLKLMGVGGISTPADLIQKFQLGADLAQVYTGWIFGGPAFVPKLLDGLLAHLEKEQMTLAELKGSGL